MHNYIARKLLRWFADRSLPHCPPPDKPHILVLRWDAKLGDAIVSSFFYREARKLEAKLTVITVSELAELHIKTFGVDNVIIARPAPGLAELFQLVKQLKHIDTVVHLVGRLQPLEILFVRLIRPRCLYSLDDELRCVNRKMGRLAATLNITEQYEYVLKDLGAKSIDKAYMIPEPTRLPDMSQVPQILFNPYASREDKCLSPSRTITVLKAIIDAFPDHTVGILCSPRTLQNARHLERCISHKNVSVVPGIFTPNDVVAYLYHATLVVSVDTAIVHMAVGLDIKLVAIYPGYDGIFNPWLPPLSSRIRVIFSPQPPKHGYGRNTKEMNAFSNISLLESMQELLRMDKETAKKLSLNARIISGLGVATKTLALQIPLISKDFPEISDCYPGTINVKLDFPIVVTHPDHRTAPLAWTPSGRTSEIFELVRIDLEFSHLPAFVPAWLYIAHNSPHRETPVIHEIIAPKINLDNNHECRLHLHASAILIEPDINQGISATNLSHSSTQNSGSASM